MHISNEKFYMKPDWRLLISHPAHFCSLGFGSGLVPNSPGTAGTLVAFPLFWLISPLMNDYLFLLFLIAAFYIGGRKK